MLCSLQGGVADISSAGTFSAHSCTFSGNTVSTKGAVVYVEAGGTALFRNTSSCTQNGAPDKGPFYAAGGASLLLEGGVFPKKDPSKQTDLGHVQPGATLIFRDLPPFNSSTDASLADKGSVASTSPMNVGGPVSYTHLTLPTKRIV